MISAFVIFFVSSLFRNIEQSTACKHRTHYQLTISVYLQAKQSAFHKLIINLFQAAITEYILDFNINFFKDCANVLIC